MREAQELKDATELFYAQPLEVIFLKTNLLILISKNVFTHLRIIYSNGILQYADLQTLTSMVESIMDVSSYHQSIP
jgi:hypothetical protein